MNEDVKNLIEHHGVKGMRWGVSKEIGTFRTTKSGKPRTGKQKLAIAGASTATTLLGLKFMQSSTLNTPLRVLVGTGIAITGGRFAKAVLTDREDRNRKLSDI